MLLLAIDDHMLPFKRHLCYYLSKPKVRKEPVLTPASDNPNAPDDRAAMFYGTVLFDEGKFRMWYYAMPSPRVAGVLREESLVCYAESPDGLHWTKPNLGQVLMKGSRDNNAIALPRGFLYGTAVIKDDDDSDPQRRYKMVYQQTGWSIRTATSPDGIDWTARPDPPLHVFIEPSSYYKHNGLHVLHAHGPRYGEGGGTGVETGGATCRGTCGATDGRQGYAWVSPDFETWLLGPAEAFALPEPSDLAKRGGLGNYDQVHLGVGAASFGNVLVGLYGVWHQRSSPTSPIGGTNCDLGLVVSNDGIHFREPVKGHVYIADTESDVPPVEGKDYPNVLCQANGILNVGDETLIYHGRWRNAWCNAGDNEDYYGEVALATLPRDRWGALGLFQDQSEGWVWSAPVRLPDGGCQISLNIEGAPQTRVELSDERFGLLPEFSGLNSGAAQDGSGLESPVTWHNSDPSVLGNRVVRLRVHITREGDLDPKLYAIYLRAASDG